MCLLEVITDLHKQTTSHIPDLLYLYCTVYIFNVSLLSALHMPLNNIGVNTRYYMLISKVSLSKVSLTPHRTS